MNSRKATDNDLSILAEWNHQLITDSGHRNPMNVSELQERMMKWLSEDYTAIIFSDEDDVAYALFRESENAIYLRQFFVHRDRRRKGIGRKAITFLIYTVWPKDKRLTIDVHVENLAGIAFWHSLGFQNYCLGMDPCQIKSSKKSMQETLYLALPDFRK